MELTISRLVKMILGIVVFIAVIAGFYFFFKDKVIELFKNVGVETPAEIILYILN